MRRLVIRFSLGVMNSFTSPCSGSETSNDGFNQCHSMSRKFQMKCLNIKFPWHLAILCGIQRKIGKNITYKNKAILTLGL